MASPLATGRQVRLIPLMVTVATVLGGCIEPSATSSGPVAATCSDCEIGAVAGLVEERATKPAQGESRASYVLRALTGHPLPDEVAGKRQRGSGSGFFVGPSELVTNHHVIDGCAAVTVRIRDQGDWLPATIIGSDAAADLAALRIAEAVDRTATFRAGAFPVPPKRLTIVGYPELGRVVVKPVTIVATAQSSDLASGRPAFRLRGVVRHGMSGSPVLDEEGRVLGVISRRVNPLARYQITGALPDADIGIAISSRIVLRFLDEHRIGYHQEAPDHVAASSTSPDDVKHYVAQVGCWK